MLPLGLWAVHNHRLTGTLFGHRGPLQNTLADSLTSGAGAVLSWYVPFVPEAKSAGLTASVLIVLAGVVGLATSFVLSRSARRRLRSSLKAVLSDHLPEALFLVTYTIVMLAAATRDAFVETRTFSPIYVPLTAVILKLAYGLLGSNRPVVRAAAGKVPSIILAVWVCFLIADVTSSTARRLQNGAGGLNSRKWRESETVAQTRRMVSGQDVPVYTNGVDALWELARVNSSELPIRSEVNLSDLRGRWPRDRGSVLVWFNNRGWRGQYLSVKELGEVANVENIAQFSDGSIYRVSVRDTAAPD
jgi:hypothetical protein